MKVLFLGHFREDSGIGQASRDYVLAMDSVGIDVVPRSIKLGTNTPELPQRFLELEAKSCKNCSHLLQLLLPHHMEFDGDFEKCIALFDYECYNFQTSGWPYKLSLFDEVWVPSLESMSQAVSSGLKNVKVVPHTTDFNRFKKDIEPGVTGDDYVFYFIGDCNMRKNLEALIKAYHTEFGIDEPVSLLIKTSKWGMSSKECNAHIEDFCTRIKQRLKLYPSPNQYKKEVIITDRLTDEQLLKIHKGCDAFVMPSYGEAFCLPALDARAMGNIVISGCGGTSMLTTEGYEVEGMLDTVNGMTDNTFPFLYTGFEQWYNIAIPELRKKMRRAYNVGKHKQFDIGDIYFNDLKSDYGYEYIGNLIKDRLNG